MICICRPITMPWHTHIHGDYLRQLISLVCSVLAITSAHSCNDYVELTDTGRSTGYIVHDGDYLCDRDLAEGWYRAVNGGGGDMPMQPPDYNHCGTLFPIWYNGVLPTANQTVSGPACVSGKSDDCDYICDIQVQNCGDYNLYYLKPTKYCPVAYCFGDRLKCGPGYDGEFVPNCTVTAATPLQSAPQLSWTVGTLAFGRTTLEQVIFECDVDTTGLDPALDLLDIKFKIGDTVLYAVTVPHHKLPAQYLTVDFDKKAIFPTLYNDETADYKLAYHKMLRCEAQTRREITGVTSPVVFVEEFYGFQVTSGTSLRIEEEEVADIVIHLNLPVLNDEVYVALHIPTFHSDFQECNTNHVTRLLTAHTSCRTIFKKSHEPQTSPIQVKGVVQDSYISPYNMVVKLVSSRIRLPFSPVISDFPLTPVAVTVVDSKKRLADMTCMAIRLSYMKLFSGVKWNMHYEGEFILYKNVDLLHEVQIKTEQCSHTGATCVCGVMVRSGRSGYIIDTCGPRKKFFSVDQKYAPRIKMFDCAEGQSDLVIDTSINNVYKFILPTKTTVTVYFRAYYGRHNVHVNPSPADYRSTGGVCGYIDPPQQAGFRLRDGTFNTDNMVFADNWRVSEDARLFTEPSLQFARPVHHCGCNDANEAICTVTDAHSDCVDKTFTNAEHNHCLERKRRRRRRRQTGDMTPQDDAMEDEQGYIEYEEQEVTQQGVYWENGWTELSAKAFCVNYISNNPSTKACRKLMDLDEDSAVETCVLDIKLTGSTSASSTHLESITSSCMTEIRKNTTLWDTVQKDGQKVFVLPQSVTAVTCPAHCSARGSCKNGVCNCENGFSGVDCSTNDTAVPEIFRVPQNGLCDRQEWTCRAIKVYAYDVFNTGSLKCRTTKYWLTSTGQKKVGRIESPAQYDRLDTVICTLPGAADIIPDNAVAKNYQVEVSNDGKHYSSPASMVVFSSKCASCSRDQDGDVQCSEKDDICKISGSCYDSEERNPSRYCQWCNVTTSRYAWTQMASTCLVGGSCYTDGQMNPRSSCDVCRPDQSSDSWTQRENSAPTLSSSVQLKKTRTEDLTVTLTTADTDDDDVTITADHNEAQVVDKTLMFGGENEADVMVRLQDECGAVSEYTIHIAIVNCPCQSYEVCIPQEPRGEGMYRCECPPGFEGDMCAIDIDECADIMCEHGTCVAGRGTYECQCEDGYEGVLCEQEVTDECFISLCVHGTCQDTYNAFECICDPGYEGELCDENVDDCYDFPCIHGTCIDGIDSYTCDCIEGFGGVLCDNNIDDCQSHSCVHGSCVDNIGYYTCTCEDGFQGVLCDNDLHNVIDDCANNPCSHGVCTDLVNDFSCACDEGYDGETCDNNIDDCDDAGCVHGDCEDGVASFSCVCEPGYNGTLCDDQLPFSPCDSSPCINGDCVFEHGFQFSCTCKEGYAGALCQLTIGKWSPWSECSQSCGVGVRSRSICMQPCDDDNIEKEADICQAPPCQVSSSGVLINVMGSDLLTVHHHVASMKHIVAAELNSVCVKDPTLCCSIISPNWFAPGHQFIQIFTYEHISMDILEGGEMIPVMTGAQIEQQMLEDACAEAGGRREHQTQMINIPATVLEKAVEESIPRFKEELGVSASLSSDDSSSFVGSPSFYAVIAAVILIIVIAVVVLGLLMHYRTPGRRVSAGPGAPQGSTSERQTTGSAQRYMASPRGSQGSIGGQSILRVDAITWAMPPPKVDTLYDDNDATQP